MELGIAFAHLRPVRRPRGHRRGRPAGRRFATLDRFSGGRAIAGIGQGWMDQEFGTTNATKALRGDGVDDFVAALRAAWGPDPVSHTGPRYRIAESLINPKPVRAEGVPVLLGGFSRRHCAGPPGSPTG